MVIACPNEAALRDGDGRKEQEQEVEVIRIGKVLPVPFGCNAKKIPRTAGDEKEPAEIPRALPIAVLVDRDSRFLDCLGVMVAPYSCTWAIIKRSLSSSPWIPTLMRRLSRVFSSLLIRASSGVMRSLSVTATTSHSGPAFPASFPEALYQMSRTHRKLRRPPAPAPRCE